MEVVQKDGLVALQHFNTNPATVKMGDGTMYSFVPKYNVSLAWVKMEHVAELLSVRTRICCGKTGLKFSYASQINVNLWTTGDRHGNA